MEGAGKKFHTSNKRSHTGFIAKRVASRETREHLKAYCRHVGISCEAMSRIAPKHVRRARERDNGCGKPPKRKTGRRRYRHWSLRNVNFKVLIYEDGRCICVLFVYHLCNDSNTSTRPTLTRSVPCFASKPSALSIPYNTILYTLWPPGRPMSPIGLVLLLYIA